VPKNAISCQISGQVNDFNVYYTQEKNIGDSNDKVFKQTDSIIFDKLGSY